MNLIRLIVITLIIWLLYRAFQRVLGKTDLHRPDAPRSITRDMVKCAHCGIHIPRDEAVCHGKTCYCSIEHLNAGPGDRGE